jgi:hypothetical protein
LSGVTSAARWLVEAGASERAGRQLVVIHGRLAEIMAGIGL